MFKKTTWLCFCCFYTSLPVVPVDANASHSHVVLQCLGLLFAFSPAWGIMNTRTVQHLSRDTNYIWETFVITAGLPEEIGICPIVLHAGLLIFLWRPPGVSVVMSKSEPPTCPGLRCVSGGCYQARGLARFVGASAQVTYWNDCVTLPLHVTHSYPSIKTMGWSHLLPHSFSRNLTLLLHAHPPTPHTHPHTHTKSKGKHRKIAASRLLHAL